MAITSAGYWGTVSDAQWARLFEPLPHWFRGDAFIPSAVSGARSVSLTAGIAFGAGVRDVSDAPITVPLTPPSSGGQWYLIVLRRIWSIGVSGTTSVQALAGPTTSGTVPSAPPSSLPGTFQATPSATDDAPVAWVHVRAADTTLTIFDARLITTATGTAAAASAGALATLALTATLPAGLMLPNMADAITYRWNGSAFKPWESDYVGFVFGTTDLAFASQACFYRYRSGVVRIEMRLFGAVSSGTGAAVPTLTLPIPANTNGSTKPIAEITALDNGTGTYSPLRPDFVDQNTIKWSFLTGSPVKRTDMTVTNLQTWDTGDQIFGTFEYDPA